MNAGNLENLMACDHDIQPVRAKGQPEQELKGAGQSHEGYKQEIPASARYQYEGPWA